MIYPISTSLSLYANVANYKDGPEVFGSMMVVQEPGLDYVAPTA